MKSRISTIAVILGGLMLSGCMEATFEAASDSSLKPRDREMLARASYAKVDVPAPFKRAIVSYHRKEAPGSIVIDSDNHFLYYVLADGKAIRYGVTVGEEALSFSGIARIGSMQEWPRWIPTADIHKRIAGLAPARSISIRAIATPCSAFTAPTSPNTSAPRFPPAASA